mmetsp:Transcript_38321/g.122973  ORF Transcript_38321/g.122973 Transcript_38321/m.122973 type:complete len:262 (-) Transcript_38321:380-1165(-)
MHPERRPHGEAAADREGRRHLAEAEVDPKRHERHVGEEDEADFGAGDELARLDAAHPREAGERAVANDQRIELGVWRAEDGAVGDGDDRRRHPAAERAPAREASGGRAGASPPKQAAAEQEGLKKEAGADRDQVAVPRGAHHALGPQQLIERARRRSVDGGAVGGSDDFGQEGDERAGHADGDGDGGADGQHVRQKETAERGAPQRVDLDQYDRVAGGRRHVGGDEAGVGGGREERGEQRRQQDALPAQRAREDGTAHAAQ